MKVRDVKSLFSVLRKCTVNGRASRKWTFIFIKFYMTAEKRKGG